MRRLIDPEEYRRACGLADDQELPIVAISGGHLLYEEIMHPDECFLKTSARFFLGQMTLDKYFDRLVGHLKIGATLHEPDKWEANAQHYLSHDLIGACIKLWMQNKDFAPLDASSTARLKELCIAAYCSETVEDIIRESTAAGVPVESAPPEWIDIITVIAYARRRVKLVQHLATSYQTPAKVSTFEKLSGGHIRYIRISLENTDFQHSPCTASSRLMEILMWTSLIRSGWVHSPIPHDRHGIGSKGIRGVLNELLSHWTPEDHHLRSSPEVKEFCEALHAIDFMLDISAIASFLSPGKDWGEGLTERSVGCDLKTAEMFLDLFPLSRLEEGGYNSSFATFSPPLRLGCSHALMKSVAEWGVDNPDRLSMMKMLLERGCYVNDRYPKWECLVGPEEPGQNDTVLHVVAARGDRELAYLLLKHGAEKDGRAGQGRDLDTSPAQRARSRGFVETAERIERYQG
ncbi:hypothetical protein QBC34DRAFT_402785 [Podospora aff. communis PSN243]|uniref:Ankyrin n=1 Tax=Podospora aff. communis PSN243 TaxID=3040156 RepID=A0AAV9GR12_9PEZI|nr:hypothetical protein QBC34DRAFT_402785 [Podospora aff. communis PSN243]